MTTLPQLPSYLPTALDLRVSRELTRLLGERLKAKEQGYWPSVRACEMAIESLRRVQMNHPAAP